MQEDQAPRGPYTWRQRTAVAVPLLLVTAAVLVACGGGSFGDGTSQASSTAEMKTVQAVSASSTASVPAGWTGRAPKMEVINGITVPPEPAPSVNNATLAGVDVNGNGVRDDVERLLAGGSLSVSFLSKTIPVASKVNEIATQVASSSSGAALQFHELYCLDKARSQDEKEIISLDDIIFATMNTPQRQFAYKKNRQLYGDSSQAGEVPKCAN